MSVCDPDSTMRNEKAMEKTAKEKPPQKPSPFPGEISTSPLGDFGTCWGKKRLCTEPLPVNSTGAVTVQRPTHE